jgi:hypothetical protein
LKKIIAATLLLTVAVMTADAQAANGKTADANFEQAFHTRAGCDPEPGRVRSCPVGPATERPPRPAAFGRPPTLSGPAPDSVEESHAEDAAAPDDKLRPSGGQDKAARVGTGFHWGAAFKQSLLFLSVQHAYALTQPKTRRDLHGPFFRDYFRSVGALHGWADGGRFFTNYVAHPMEGSLLGFIQVQNDPAGSRLRFNDSGYWRSRMKALAWSAAWSTQFEIGPVSQASIGNVGLHGKQTYVDIVMTPTAGLGLLVAEDALDRYVVGRIERRTNSKYARIFSRMALNPTRTAANLLRFKKPWYRDAGLR